MFRNRLKAQWAEGRPAINGWLSIGNPFTAEIMAAQGYDSVTIDAQHGALDYSAVLSMLQAMRASGVTPMVTNGAQGSIEGNWIATGRKMQHDSEVYGTKGTLAFSQERFNELHFHSTPPGQRGFRHIEAGPEHPPHGRFCVAAGRQIGFNDLKANEIEGYLRAIAGEIPEPFGFAAGLRIQHLAETIRRSSAERQWLEVPG